MSEYEDALAVAQAEVFLEYQRLFEQAVNRAIIGCEDAMLMTDAELHADLEANT